MAILLTPRVLKEAKAQATLLANRMHNAWTRNAIKSWDDIESQFNLAIPDTFKKLPFTYSNFSSFKTFWISNVELRLSVATESKKEEVKIKVIKDVSTFGSFTLKPDQEGVYRSIYEAFRTNKVRAAIQDGYTGCGKMIMAAAVITKSVQDGLLETPEAKFRLHPIMILTPKGVAESWRRCFEAFGLGKLVATKKINIFNHSSFDTEAGRLFCREDEDISTGEISLQWNPIMAPLELVIDESHGFINPKAYRTRVVEALIQSRLTNHIMFTSATPMEKVNDSYIYTLATGAELLGVKVTKETFKYFANLLDSRPDKPNREAMKRLRQVLSPFIFSIPYIKPKHKAVNVVQLVDFRTPQDAIIYSTAHDRYKEACKKAGKNTAFGAFEARVALLNYLKTVEPLRAYWIADRAAKNYYDKRVATACGCQYKETVVNIAFDLVSKHNIPREKISIIWGGKKEYRREDLLSRAELDNILKAPDLKEIIKNLPLLKKIKITLRYLQDQEEHSETANEQAERHNKLRELKLVGKQSDNQRQIEIDKFQSGESLICLFTNASGGVGISLDCSLPSLLPREGIFTPCYSGKVFQQVLGRLVRRASIADALQIICMMAGTVEEHHVAPILDEKLKCIAEITNRNFDVTDILSKDVPTTDGHVSVRSIAQAEHDAELDNTIVADFADKEIEDEDEEDLSGIQTAEDLVNA